MYCIYCSVQYLKVVIPFGFDVIYWRITFTTSFSMDPCTETHQRGALICRSTRARRAYMHNIIVFEKNHRSDHIVILWSTDQLKCIRNVSCIISLSCSTYVAFEESLGGITTMYQVPSVEWAYWNRIIKFISCSWFDFEQRREIELSVFEPVNHPEPRRTANTLSVVCRSHSPRTRT